jgi:hypothetical protein
MKNLSNYNSVVDIGTTHWFRTLVGQANKIGEFIKLNPNHKAINYGNYGELLQNIMKDLLEWQETNQPLRNELEKDKK